MKRLAAIAIAAMLSCSGGMLNPAPSPDMPCGYRSHQCASGGCCWNGYRCGNGINCAIGSCCYDGDDFGPMWLAKPDGGNSD